MLDAAAIEDNDKVKEIIQWPSNRVWETNKAKQIVSLFGASSVVVADLWNRIEPALLGDKSSGWGAEPKHLLWALLFLKVYAKSEEVHCAIVGWPHSDTFRKWSWYFVRKIFELQEEVIVWENGFLGQPQSATGEYLPAAECMVSVDWLDCPCYEAHPFLTDMYSEKFNEPAIW